MKYLILLIVCWNMVTKITAQNVQINKTTDMKTTHVNTTVKNNVIKINGISVFYREAGNPANQTILLLHGFPSSSHMYRNLMEGLSENYHLIAPDYPGFGLSDVPDASEFEYTFDNVSKLIETFIEKLELKSFYLLMQDYGGPVGFRIAVNNPKRIDGLIIQNANAYLEGLGEWPMKMGELAKNNDMEGLAAFKDYFMSPEGIKEQYISGAARPSEIDPISYRTDAAFLRAEHVKKVQTLLLNNYESNFPKYAEWQAYFKEHQPRTLILWGENDKFFSRPGGEAYSKDLNNATKHFFNGGHFMLEEYPEESISLIKSFIN